MADQTEEPPEETKQAGSGDLQTEIDALTEGQRKTYNVLVETDLKDVTQEQLVKAAQEFGVDTDGAINYLTKHDPDAGDQVAEPDFLTEVTQGQKVESNDKRAADLESGGKETYEHTQRCATYEIYLISGILNVIGLIVAWTCAFVFEQWYLMGITGANWYWASQLCSAGFWKFLTVKGNATELKFRWNVAESSDSVWWTRTVRYDEMESFTRRPGCGSGETCSKNVLTMSGNGCTCFPCAVCKNQDVIEFELKKDEHWNCCSGGKKEGCCASWCRCFDQSIDTVRVSTDDLKALGDFLLQKGVKEKDQTAVI